MKLSCSRQSGFSLMEVLFAVVVLTLGLVFVAAQFPVGLYNSRVIYDETISELNRQNTRVQLRLEIENILNSGFDPCFAFEYQNSHIHPVVRPNILADTVNTDLPVIVQDDLLHYGQYLRNHRVPVYRPYPRDFPVEPQWPFIFYHTSSDPANALTLANPNHLAVYNADYPQSGVGGFDRSTDIFIGDIGKIMLPAVDRFDPDVIKQLPAHLVIDLTRGNPTLDELVDVIHREIYDVAMEQRSYHWHMLYQSQNRYRYKFFFFTLRNNKTNLRYAVQTDADIVNGIPVPADPQFDRHFPIPWRINLNYDQNIDIEPRNYVISGDPVSDIFDIDPIYFDMFREGTIIIDDDDENWDYINGEPDPTPWRDNGYVYTIVEVLGNKDDGFQIRLDRPLEDHLNNIWFFPPPITRTGNDFIFTEDQPVVNVTTNTITF